MIMDIMYAVQSKERVGRKLVEAHLLDIDDIDEILIALLGCWNHKGQKIS